MTINHSPKLLAALLLALAGSAGVAACGGSNCQSGDLAIDWQLRDSYGASRSCAGMGVAYIDIYVDGVRQVDAAQCSSGGAVITYIPEGSHHVLVDGLDASLAIVLTDAFTANTGCGTSSYLSTPRP